MNTSFPAQPPAHIPRLNLEGRCEQRWHPGLITETIQKGKEFWLYLMTILARHPLDGQFVAKILPRKWGNGSEVCTIR